MKLMHLADLHLGRRMNDISLLPDQICLLEQITMLAEAQQVDAVLIAGDVYDKPSPPAEAMAALNDFLTALAQRGIRVYMISGNHDAARRISYFSALIEGAGVFVSPEFDGTLRRCTLHDDHGPVDITLMPFLRPASVRRFYPEAEIGSVQQAIAAVLAHNPPAADRRNVLLCHQFVAGAQTCDSEEHTIGGLDQVDGTLFDGYDYVALGHIHKSQKVLRDTMRYAGSLMKYSFSEANHKKSVPIICLGAKGDVTVEKYPLQPPRDVRLVEGGMDALMHMEYSEDYVHVILTDELIDPDARVSLTTVFPNMMKFTVRNSKTTESVDVGGTESIENKSVTNLLEDFYRLQNNGAALPAEYMDEINEILREMEDDG